MKHQEIDRHYLLDDLLVHIYILLTVLFNIFQIHANQFTILVHVHSGTTSRGHYACVFQFHFINALQWWNLNELVRMNHLCWRKGNWITAPMGHLFFVLRCNYLESVALFLVLLPSSEAVGIAIEALLPPHKQNLSTLTITRDGYLMQELCA